MQLKDIAGDLRLSPEQGQLSIRGLTADSREVKEGYVFAALKGTHVDGAGYIADARAKGAAAFLVGIDSDLVAARQAAGSRPVMVSEDPRRMLALMAARFYGHQPETIVAVTGTSGKTSVAVFVRQIFAAAHHEAASLGTIGTVTSRGETYGGLTTPDPVTLQRDLARLADDGITHAAMEASSHGLDQRRLDGARIKAAAFTNLGRDHLDYHPDMESYLAAKLRLFDTLLPANGTIVVEPSAPYADRIIQVAKERGVKLLTVGEGGGDLRLADIQHEGFSQILSLETADGPCKVRLPLAGRFQVSNALVAAGLALAAGIPLDQVLTALEHLEGAPGRLELVGRKGGGASDRRALCFVDYAHKPEALENALSALRPFTRGHLIVVIGAGGDRDPGKRVLMGKAAHENADVVIVTDDNPRSENPAMIRQAVLEGAPGAIEIGDRNEAIAAAVSMLEEGDILCVAGKGHETGQIVGDRVLPFSDHDAIQRALAHEAEAMTDKHPDGQPDGQPGQRLDEDESPKAAEANDAGVESATGSPEDKPRRDLISDADFDELFADLNQSDDVPDDRTDTELNSSDEDIFADAETESEAAEAEIEKSAVQDTETEVQDPLEPAFEERVGEEQAGEDQVGEEFVEQDLTLAASPAPPLSQQDEARTPEPASEPMLEEASDVRVLWILSDFLTATGGRLVGEPEQPICGISIDSRTIGAGDAFFAIKGDAFDGHDFVKDALKGGAALAVVAKERAAEMPAAGPLVIVEDPLEAMRGLGRAARARTDARIVAITGSVGKTGTKEMLRLALTRTGRTHAAVASFNNHWGVPLTLARMPADTEFGVFEIGMNHAGEITPLVEMVRPHVAIITTVQPVHLEFFGSVEKIAQAKAEIFSGLEPGGVAVLNRDNEQFDLLIFHAKMTGVRNIRTFAVDHGADAQAKKYSAQTGCTCISATVMGEEITYKVGAPGLHYVKNSLAVLAAVKELGGDLALAGLALAEMRAPKGRGAQTALKLPSGKVTLIDESYNANPASMRAALRLLGETPVTSPGRRIAVLGDMRELGEASDELHAALFEPLMASGVDFVYCAGEHMHQLWDLLPTQLRGAYSEEAKGLRPLLINDVRPGDVVMVKGSLGTQMGPLVAALMTEYPAADEAAE